MELSFLRNSYLEMQDLQQEVKKHRLEGDTRPARFIMIDELRKTYPVSRRYIEVEPYKESLAKKIDVDGLLDLCKWLSQWTGKRRRVLFLYLQGYTQREIAEKLNCTESNISVYMRKIKQGD